MKPTLRHIPHDDRSSSFTSRRPGPIVGFPGVLEDGGRVAPRATGTSGRYPRGRLKCLDAGGGLAEARQP